MATSAITYSLHRDAPAFMRAAAMPCGWAQAGVRGYVTLARRYAR